MRVLHVVQVRPQVESWMKTPRRQDATGIGGLLLLREMVARMHQHTHVVVLLGVEDDRTVLEGLGIRGSVLVSPALRSPRRAGAAIERIVERTLPAGVLGWGQDPASAMRDLPAWVAKFEVDLLTSRVISMRGDALSVPLICGALHAAPRLLREKTHLGQTSPNAAYTALGIMDAATPLALHHVLYALGSATVAGLELRIMIPASSCVDNDLIALQRAQHYLRGIHVVDASFEEIAHAADFAIVCTDTDQPIGVAATHALVHACIAQDRPVLATLTTAEVAGLPRAVFSPGSVRGNHTDLARMIVDLYADPHGFNVVLEEQRAWAARAASTLDDLEGLLASRGPVVRSGA